MSEPRRASRSISRRIHAESQARRPLARAVHGSCADVLVLGVLATLALGGCVIPPSLSIEDGDAGVNSPPAILAVRSDQQELAEPGPVTFARGSGTIHVTLLDTDVDDTLHVHVFVDYKVTDPTAPRSECTAPPNGTAQRSATCDLSALCLSSDVGAERFMQVQVFDREPLESGAPRFKAMPPGGLTTSRFYQLACTEPQE